MKRKFFHISVLFLLVSSIVTAYVVGYVNGSDSSIQFTVGTQLGLKRNYFNWIDQGKTDRVKKSLLVDLEGEIAKSTDVTRKRYFPLDHYKRFIFLERLGIGETFWKDFAEQESKKAQELLNKSLPNTYQAPGGQE